MKPVKLFCIPYSGGSAEVYWKWNKHLADQIELCPVEIGGRGKRMYEPLPDRFEDVIEDLSSIIMGQLKATDKYAIYGHSMGSLLAFETYYKLMEKGCHAPCHLFLSGREAPQTIHPKTNYHQLSDEEFLKVVLSYGGNTKDILENKELLQLFLPILRADFKMAETYEYKEKSDKIASDITVINGSRDQHVAHFDMNDWRFFAGKQCEVKKVLGGHFFITEEPNSVVNIINQALQNG
ncbi:MAG TPA: thioesterase domain-containing protein [Bacilli bacterium]|nr:thioesterase domain-containing protein [Bacilli bacterium]